MEQRTNKLLNSIKNKTNTHEAETMDTASADNESLSRSNNSAYIILKNQILNKHPQIKKMEGKFDTEKPTKNLSKFASSIHS